MCHFGIRLEGTSKAERWSGMNFTLVAGRPGQMRRRASPGDAVIEIARADDSRGRRTGSRPLRAHVEVAAARSCGVDGHLIHVVHDGALAKTLPSPTPAPAEAQRRASPLLRTLGLSWLSRPVRGGAVGNWSCHGGRGWWG